MLLAAPPASSGECPKARLCRRRTRCVSFPTHFGSSLGQFPFLPFTSPFCIKLTLVSGTHLTSPTSGACGSCKLWYKSVQLPSRRLTLASENFGAEEYGRGLEEPQQASCSPRSCTFMMFSQGTHPAASSHLLAVSQPLSPVAADCWLLSTVLGSSARFARLWAEGGRRAVSFPP